MPLQLCFIRHGETEWTLSAQHTGITDIPLTAHDEVEAQELGRRIQGIPFARVLTSSRNRARQTCELVGLGRGAEVEADLAEWDYGDYEGRSTVDIRKERPGWNVYRDGCPHGEAPAQVAVRADRLIAKLRALHGNIALFSHGQFGSVSAARWIGLPVIVGQHFPLGEAACSILGYEPSHPEAPVIALWNAPALEVLDKSPDPHVSSKRE